MAAQNDVDFDVAAARSWKMEVSNELTQVSSVLAQVNQVCSTIPGEDDTIMKGFESAGEIMSSAWEELKSGYSWLCDKFGELIDQREQSAQRVSDLIDNFKANFSL